MKYAIIGAGGTGGSLGFFLTKAGKDEPSSPEENTLRRSEKMVWAWNACGIIKEK